MDDGWPALDRDSLGHAYLFDILRSEMRFFSFFFFFNEARRLPTELRISRSGFSLFRCRLSRLPLSSSTGFSFTHPLVYELGNELWQLAARKILHRAVNLPRTREVFASRDRPGRSTIPGSPHSNPTVIILFSATRRLNDCQRLIGWVFFLLTKTVEFS